MKKGDYFVIAAVLLVCLLLFLPLFLPPLVGKRPPNSGKSTIFGGRGGRVKAGLASLFLPQPSDLGFCE